MKKKEEKENEGCHQDRPRCTRVIMNRDAEKGRLPRRARIAGEAINEEEQIAPLLLSRETSITTYDM